jgi:hypothetical protein
VKEVECVWRGTWIMKGLWLSKTIITIIKKKSSSFNNRPPKWHATKKMNHRRPSSHKNGLIPTLGWTFLMTKKRLLLGKFSFWYIRLANYRYEIRTKFYFLRTKFKIGFLLIFMCGTIAKIHGGEGESKLGVNWRLINN